MDKKDSFEYKMTELEFPTEEMEFGEDENENKK